MTNLFRGTLRRARFLTSACLLALWSTSPAIATSVKPMSMREIADHSAHVCWATVESTTSRWSQGHRAIETEARDDFAAWGRNHQKRLNKAKAIHSPSRTEARDDFAAWGRNHQKRSNNASRTRVSETARAHRDETSVTQRAVSRERSRHARERYNMQNSPFANISEWAAGEERVEMAFGAASEFIRTRCVACSYESRVISRYGQCRD